MQAYVLHGYGGPQKARLEELGIPEPGPRDVLVRVRAAGLNPVDFKFREGKLRAVIKAQLPFVLGNELAGEVVALGSEARKFQIGDRVFARLAKDRGGAFAEQVSVDEALAARVPAKLELAGAAAVPLAGLTALQALRDELKVGPGVRVLISGGAGGVGTFAIQIAKWLGAHVTTTASPRGEVLVRSLGCDAVIDYTRQDLSTVAERFDAGFDLIGGATLNQMFKVMRPGSKVVSVAALPEPQTARIDLARPHLVPVFWLVSAGIRARAGRSKVSYRYLFMHPSGSDLALLADLIDRGALKVIVGKTFRFPEIADALAYLESGHAKGKVVVTMG